MNRQKTPLPSRKAKSVRPRFVLCIRNEGYSASLEKRKIYRVLPDRDANAHDMIRIVDESGEDYLYPMGWFVPIIVPQTAVRELALAI
ncbi:MAG: hypothetical protein HY260_11625 [Chloroflexi bacterium]|nr:hypothetical protein [Chloroflexota bacterium]